MDGELTVDGYTPHRKVYKLRFADPEMDGLVVRARSLPLGRFLSLASLVKAGNDIQPERLAELFEGFAGSLVDWNLTGDDGEPVPATLDGVYSQEPDFMLAIILPWIEVVASISSPLGKPSSGGGPSPEASIPMEVLSASQAS